MPRLSFSVSGLMAAVLLAALALVALRDPGLLTVSLVFSLAVAMFSVAAVLGCARRGRARAGWLSLALAGTAYLHFAFAGGNPECPPLITTAALTRVFDHLPSSAAPSIRVTQTPTLKSTITVKTGSWSGGGGIHASGTGTGSGSSGTGSGIAGGVATRSMNYTLPAPDPDSFTEPNAYSISRRYARGQVGHSILALAFGLVGGLAGRQLADRDGAAP